MVSRLEEVQRKEPHTSCRDESELDQQACSVSSNLPTVIAKAGLVDGLEIVSGSSNSHSVEPRTQLASSPKQHQGHSDSHPAESKTNLINGVETVPGNSSNLQTAQSMMSLISRLEVTPVTAVAHILSTH